jgi:hypothetical protein
MSSTQPHGSSAPATLDTKTKRSAGVFTGSAAGAAGRQRQPAHPPTSKNRIETARSQAAGSNQRDRRSRGLRSADRRRLSDTRLEEALARMAGL